MASARIMGASWADDATITATSEALDADNLKDTSNRPWRSTGPSGSPSVIADQNIDIDFGESKSPTWLFIDGLNNHGGMSGVVRLSDDNFSTFTYTAALDILTLKMMQHFFTGGANGRYMRITLSDPTNSDDYIEAVRIKVGEYFDAPSSKNVGVGPALSFVERGALVETRGGSFRAEQKDPKRRLEVVWQWAHDDDNWTIDAESFASLLENIGYRDDVVISVYPEEGTDREYRHTILGRMVENSGLQGHSLIKSGSDVVLYSSLNIAVVGSLPRKSETRLPRMLSRYVYGSPLITTGVTTARTGESGYVSDGAGGWTNFAAQTPIIEDDSVVVHPAYTRLDDRDDDLSGGAETLDLTSAGTGNYTLSVYGTAAVTVAAGTAVGTGFGQATEGSPVTFNLSTAGTVTLTLDSGTLDTVGGKAAKQVQKNPFATPIAAVASVSATLPLVPWPSGLVNDFVVKLNIEDSYIASGNRIVDWWVDSNNTRSVFWNSNTNPRIQNFIAGVITNSSGSETTVSNQTGVESEMTIWYSSRSGKKLWVGATRAVNWNNTVNLLAASNMALGFTQRFNANHARGKRGNIRIYKVSPFASESEVLGL